MDWQSSTLNAFVVAKKHERYLQMVSSDKHHPKLIAALSHFHDFDDRWVVTIPPSQQRPESIFEILRRHGAPAMCNCISEIKELDGKELPLIEALQRTVGYQMGTILSCVPGRLAFFENEDSRFILERAQ